MSHRNESCGKWKGVLLACLLGFTVTLIGAAPTPDLWARYLAETDLTEVPNDWDSIDRIASSDDGKSLAVSRTAADKKSRSLLFISTGDGNPPVYLEMPGTIVGLAFANNSDLLYAAIRKIPRSKKALPEVHLASIRLSDLKSRRLLRLPSSLQDIAWGPKGDFLVLACQNEIRTLRSPDLRSGPLFPLPGDNITLSALSQTRWIVGQPGQFVMIDFEDTPEEKSLPIRAQVSVEGSPLDARWQSEHGRLTGLMMSGELVTWAPVERKIVAQPEVKPAPVLAPEPDSVVETVVEPEPQPEPVPVPVPAPEPDPDPELEPEPQAVPEPVVEPAPEPEPMPEPAPQTVATTEPEGQLTGRLEGPAAGNIEAVVFLGPDNLMREAARVRPDANGWWSVSDLAPGRYQIQLSAGSNARAVAQPPFLIVQVPESGSTTADPMHVLRID
jgi:hypothetical protein